MLRSQRSVVRRQVDGDDIDLDAWCEARADFVAGLPLSERVYRRQSRHRRDLAVLVLIDVSGSTDGWVAPGRRVIDVGREALLVVSIALDGMGAPFHAVFQGREEPVRSFKLEGNFGYQGEIDVLTGDRGAGRDESGVASHNLDDGDTVMHAVRFGMCAGNDFGRFFDGRQVAKGA